MDKNIFVARQALSIVESLVWGQKTSRDESVKLDYFIVLENHFEIIKRLSTFALARANYDLWF